MTKIISIQGNLCTLLQMSESGLNKVMKEVSKILAQSDDPSLFSCIENFHKYLRLYVFI